MITQEMKDNGIHCKGRGFNCYNCKDADKCIEYVKCEAPKLHPVCEVCKKAITNSVYQVMVYREDGTQEFVKTDSEDCAKDLRDKYFALHQRRANDVINQSIQKIK